MCPESSICLLSDLSLALLVFIVDSGVLFCVHWVFNW